MFTSILSIFDVNISAIRVNKTVFLHLNSSNNHEAGLRLSWELICLKVWDELKNLFPYTSNLNVKSTFALDPTKAKKVQTVVVEASTVFAEKNSVFVCLTPRLVGVKG